MSRLPTVGVTMEGAEQPTFMARTGPEFAWDDTGLAATRVHPYEFSCCSRSVT